MYLESFRKANVERFRKPSPSFSRTLDCVDYPTLDACFFVDVKNRSARLHANLDKVINIIINNIIIINIYS